MKSVQLLTEEKMKLFSSLFKCKNKVQIKYLLNNYFKSLENKKKKLEEKKISIINKINNIEKDKNELLEIAKKKDICALVEINKYSDNESKYMYSYYCLVHNCNHKECPIDDKNKIYMFNPFKKN